MARKNKRNRNRKNKGHNKQNNKQKIQQDITHFIFKPIDTWFFKESRSMDSSGSNMLVSLFPPPSKTLLGAIRSQIGEKYHTKHNTTWDDFNKKCGLAEIIGYGDNYAHLQIQGAWLYNHDKKQLYFPAPANLLRQGDKKEGDYAFFTIGKEIESDLGKVKFAQLDFKKEQSPLENHYISCTEFNKVLNGKAPTSTTAITDIVSKESRLGIARDAKTHNVEQGKLYQTEHVRIHNDWSVYLGLTATIKNRQFLPDANIILRLGGEARMASLTHVKNVSLPIIPSIPHSQATVGLVIYLMSPLPDYRKNKSSPPLPNATFAKNEAGLWQGKISDKNITIKTAIVGKLFRLGGWDMVRHQPQAVQSYIPAGSCWYIKAQDRESAQTIIDKLHKHYLTTGNDRALGYGQIAIGIQPLNTEDEK